MGAELPDYQSYFNSRPHGGRQARPIFFDASRDINSRPHGGRHSCHAIDIVTVNISTHALTEGDVFSSVKSMHAFNFNSRPHGGHRNKALNHISTHALTEGDMRSEDR